MRETDRRRLVRYANDSVQELRRRGKIKPHQTWIPRRICDTNIRREQPSRINYISQSRDLAKFRPLRKMVQPIEPLEREFTEFGQYPGWQLPLFNTVDGACTHGWDSVEVLFDITKPGHFFNRHIGHGNLWFSKDVEDIQEAPIALVVYGATIPQLEEYETTFGFDAAQVRLVAKALEAREDKADSKLPLYKVYFKEKGFVWVGWHAEECRDWLKKPEKLYLGVVEDGVKQYEIEYPIHILRYDISENEIITETRGRVFRDEHDQEAMTQTTSALVNRVIISAWILYSKKEGSEVGQDQTEVTLKDGAMVDPGSFFNIDPPDPGLFSAIQALVNLNSNESSQVNYAAMNRKDSRKTAKEMSVAESAQIAMSAVDVMLLSLFLQGVFTLDWRIFRSQVVQGKIESSLEHAMAYYESEYMLVPSGDSDVIRRQEINMAMKQDWPVIQNTGAAEVFLADLMRASPYAENAQKYINAMQTQNRKDRLLLGMKNALQMLVKEDPKMANAPALKELEQEYAAVMNPQASEGQAANEAPGSEPTDEREAA